MRGTDVHALAVRIAQLGPGSSLTFKFSEHITDTKFLEYFAIWRLVAPMVTYASVRAALRALAKRLRRLLRGPLVLQIPHATSLTLCVLAPRCRPVGNGPGGLRSGHVPLAGVKATGARTPLASVEAQNRGLRGTAPSRAHGVSRPRVARNLLNLVVFLVRKGMVAAKAPGASGPLLKR